jgi:hypothetical protein
MPRGLTLKRNAFSKPAAALLLAAITATLGADAPEQRPDGDLAAWVSQRVRLWQPAASERRFDTIGWASDLFEARRLAKEHHRPIFLFTHDGHMAVGRC